MIFKPVTAKNLFRFGSKVLGNIGKRGLELKKREKEVVSRFTFLGSLFRGKTELTADQLAH